MRCSNPYQICRFMKDYGSAFLNTHTTHIRIILYPLYKDIKDIFLYLTRCGRIDAAEVRIGTVTVGHKNFNG